MSGKRKQEMREIAAEEYDNDGLSTGSDIRRNNWSFDRVAHRVLRIIDRIAALPPGPPKDCIYCAGGVCCDCDKVPCDHMPKFAKPPPKEKEERVEEIRKMLCDAAGKSPRGVFYYQGMAEQIVATEPKAMSREEMVEVVAKLTEEERVFPENAAAIRQGNRSCWFADGVLTAIDALAGKIPASNNEVEALKGHVKREQEHSANMAKVAVKQLAKIEEFRQLAQDRYGEIMDLKAEIVRLKHTPAEGPDRLDRICNLLWKIPDNPADCGAYMFIHKNRSGAVECTGDEGWLCEFDADDDPEQTIAKYVAGLEKPSDLQRELDGLGDGYPELTKLVEEKLAEKKEKP